LLLIKEDSKIYDDNFQSQSFDYDNKKVEKIELNLKNE
jgi:hypothetical protein